MRKNSLWIGLGVLAVMCAGYLGVSRYTDISEEESREAEEASKTYLTSDSPLVEFGYDNGSVSVTFAREDGGSWQYTEDADFPVNDLLVDSAAETARKLEAVRDLGAQEDLEEYGLLEPACTFTVKDEEGVTTVISVGNETEEGDCYAKIEGKERVYTIGSSLAASAKDSLYGWIDLEEFPNITADEITEIGIQKDGTAVHYTRPKETESGEETAQSQGAGEAGAESETAASETGEGSSGDETEISEGEAADGEGTSEDEEWPADLAAQLAVLSAESCAAFKPDEEELAGYGLTEPKAILSYAYASGDESGTVTLAVGAETEDGEYYYTRLDGSNLVNRVAKDLIDRCISAEE